MSVPGLPQTYPPAYSQIIQSKQNQDVDPLQIVEKSASQTQQDEVSISSGGRLLNSLPSLFSEEIDADGVITLDEMRGFFREKLPIFNPGCAIA